MGTNVRVNQRTETEIYFINVLRELFADCENFMINHSKNKVDYITERTLDAIIECLDESLRGNSIVISKTFPKQDFLARREHFQKAYAALTVVDNLLDTYSYKLIVKERERKEYEKKKKKEEEEKAKKEAEAAKNSTEKSKDDKEEKPKTFKEKFESNSIFYTNSKVAKFRLRCAGRINKIKASIVGIIKHDVTVFNNQYEKSISKAIRVAKENYQYISTELGDNCSIFPITFNYSDLNGNVSIDIKPLLKDGTICPIKFLSQKEINRYKNETQFKEDNIEKLSTRIICEERSLSTDEMKILEDPEVKIFDYNINDPAKYLL